MTARTLSTSPVFTRPALVPDTTPADAHFTAASQLVHLAGSLRGEHQRLTIESVKNEVALGLRAIAERRFTAYPLTARELESMAEATP